MKIAVAGTGYVGLVTGVCLANVGHEVVCVDVDADKIAKLRDGISPIYEPGLEELMRANSARLTYTEDYAAAYADAEVIFIGVGTPEKKDGSANLSYVDSVAVQIARSVRRDCVVVLKSTVPIGTNDRVEALLRQNLSAPVDICMASNPEFLAQGTAVRDTLHASRIVVGADCERARDTLLAVYRDFGAPMLVTDRRSAEMIKYASNDFLALKISYINEIANLCESVGADVDDVSRGMGLDPRIGDKFLRAGIGYGGSCFPKDTKALSWLAAFNDREIKTVKAAIEVNEQQKLRLIKKAHRYYPSFEGLRVAVLGLTFKPDTDDLRDAPSLVNIPILLDDGARIRAWDPAGTENFRRLYPDELTYCGSIEETLGGADICFIFTEWRSVCELTPDVFAALMRRPIVMDGRNCFPVRSFFGTPVTYESIGRAAVIEGTVRERGDSY